MKDDYAPRACVPLQAGTIVEHPFEMPELVHMNDPAWMVFTDFTQVRPGVISADAALGTALAMMRESGVCMLLVTDEQGSVTGLLTADECYGEEPVRVAERSHIDHSKIMVNMVMTPLSDLRVMQWSHMKDARVGHIVATLHQLETQHLLVVGGARVRGVFIAGQIARQAGHPVTDEALPAHSLAEIVQTLR